MQLGTIMVTIGATIGVVGGITIMLSDPADRLTGGFIGLLGLAICVGAYFKAVSDDQKELDRQRKQMDNTEEMSANIKAMSTSIDTMSENISNLAEEIRKDRKQKNKEKGNEDNTAGHS